jgi:UDP-2,3-diacylglucosamine hydrolase
MPARLQTPCLILSDAHLGAAPPEAEASLVALLSGEARHARSLVINGDLFDFWFEWRHVMPRTGYRALAAIAAVRAAGVEVIWVAGNHDCWGGEILQEAGVVYHVGPWEGAIGPWRTLIEHGDGLREKEDAPYRRLRSVLRNPLAIWAFRHLLHPDWATAIARRSSHTSRNMRPRDGGDGLRRVAEQRLSGGALDLYVFGHTHAPAIARAAHGVYANPGAWLDGARFLRVTDQEVELVESTGQAERVVSREARPAGRF